MTSLSHKRLIHGRLALAVHAALLIATPSFAFAQDAAPDEARTLDTIEVTGTRIKRAEVEGQVPVQVLTREDIDRSGQTSIGDIVQELTGSGSALNTKFNSSGNFGFSPNGDGVGAGSAQVDLRHLGPKRVLVLVDGVRWVNESSASGVGAATDLNTIPLAIVERIEVLEDGASAIYGSDAIAGVVNIITRRNFDGGQVTLNYGQYSEGDGATTGVDVAWGHTTDRSSLFLGASYVDQDVVFSRDREQSRFPIPGTGLTFGSSGTPNGRFIFLPGTPNDVCPLTDLDGDPATPAVAFCNITTPNGSSFSPRPVYPDDFIGFGTANRFNFAEFNLLVTPSKRTGVFGQFRFDITDNVQWYIKALGNRRESVNQAAPEPIFLGPDAGTGNPLADNINIPFDHPFNPFGIDLNSRGPGANLVLIGRRPVEGGPRIFEQEVDTNYVSTGFTGNFDAGGRFWAWDVNAAYSKNKAEQTNFGSYNIRNIALGLGDTLADGATCDNTPGCVDVNIFGGPGTLTPEMLAWIQPVVRDVSEQELSLVSANLSSDLFEGWAGPVAFATGYEYRKYEGFYQPDPLTVAGFYNGVPSQPTSGEYDVNEVYLELSVPLLRDSVWGKSLDLSLAGRYSDYSTFGGEFTPKYGLRWQLADDLLLRTTFSKGFRAPSIGELFGSASRADLQIDDPCLVGLDGSPPSGNPANCAALGVPPGTQQTNSQISVTTGGNEELEPELANSFTAGFVYSPYWAADTSWSDKLDFEVTFYRHDIQGAIQAIDAQTQLNLCVDTLDPTFCDGITRSSVGSINGFNNRLTNLGSIKTEGFDVDLFWTLPDTDAGRFKLSWQNTFVTGYEAIGAAGQVQPRAPGIEVTDSGIPEWTSTAVLDWRLSNWTAAWTVRHISELTENCGDTSNPNDFPGICSDPVFEGLDPDGNELYSGTNHLSPTTYHDVQVGYKFDWLKGLQLTAGVNNLFDEDPPICLSCSLNGYDASTYDIPGGQFWYLRADLRF